MKCRQELSTYRFGGAGILDAENYTSVVILSKMFKYPPTMDTDRRSGRPRAEFRRMQWNNIYGKPKTLVTTWYPISRDLPADNDEASCNHILLCLALSDGEKCMYVIFIAKINIS